jgi:thioredoxin 1
MPSVKADLKGQMRVLKVDVDKKKSVSSKYKIKSLPTLAIFQNGKIVWRESGMKTKSQLLAIANHYINEAATPTTTSSVETKEKESWFKKLFS